MEIQKYFEEFKQELENKNLYKNCGSRERITRQLSELIKFLSSYKEEWKNEAESDDIVFKIINYLVTLKDRNGLYYSGALIQYYIYNMKIFLNWLQRKRYIEKNPADGKTHKSYREAIDKRIKERREKKLEQNYNKISEEKQFEFFVEHLKKYYQLREQQQMLRSAEQLNKFIKEKKIETITEEEIKNLIFSISTLSLIKARFIEESTIQDIFRKMRIYSNWLYDEGYIKKDALYPVTREKVKKYLTELKEEKQPLKERYYGIKEILRAYDKYLKSELKHYGDYKKSMNDLKFYIRFLLPENKTLYTADKETAEKFKKHVLNYEYLPKQYYSENFISERINRVKRFYDWFVFKNYVKENPFKGFKIRKYKKSISLICKQRKKNLSYKETVPEQFKELFEKIISYESTLNLSKGTEKNHMRGYCFYLMYLDKTGVKDIKEAEEETITDYQMYLKKFKKREGKFLSLNTHARHLVALKIMYAYLWRLKYVERDLSAYIKLPKGGRGLPTSGMTDKEVDKLITAREPETPLEIRNRAILETFYSTGVRANELMNMKIGEVNFQDGFVKVSVPKGGIKYQRVIPIGREALYWIKRYLEEVREEYNSMSNRGCRHAVTNSKTDYLFLNRYGGKIGQTAILGIVKSYLMKSKLQKNVVTHSFRVSCATEMLKNNAGIKFIQSQLGHTSIQSTERYLRLVPIDLKKIHAETHPREVKYKKE
ncbi:MAG: hypothetical protein ACD_79C00849G0001 [uncultured bacterium]|nr:MAG: hypothetical protein ACD_79C00849G0001 [uncultured bacterium]